MVKLLVRDRETIQEAVRRFRKLVERAGLKQRVRDKPTESGIIRRQKNRLRVEIHLPNAVYANDIAAIRALRNATRNFLNRYGVVPDKSREGLELHSSWHWGRWFKILGRRTADETKEIYEDLKEGLRRQQIDAHCADAYQKRAESTATLIKSLQPFDNAILRIGDVVIAKATVEGRARIAVHTLSPKQARHLDENAELASDAIEFFRYIDSLPAPKIPQAPVDGAMDVTTR